MKNNRDLIIKFCSDYLDVEKFSDGCFNGLQVEGVKDVKKIITGVSLSRQLIEAAIEKKAQMVMVHHGIFDSAINKPIVIKGFMKERLKLILENEMNLAGFHLPLDAHPIIGNNISLCRALGVLHPKPFDVGFVGELKESMEFSQFIKLVNEKLGVRSKTIAAGPKTVKKVGVISGGASRYFKVAAELGADTYLTGDLREDVVWEAEETGTNLINAGHYNTEKLGILNLGNMVAKKFKVQVEFVDIPCEI